MAAVAPAPCNIINAVPSDLVYANDPTALKADSLPVIDFSAITSADPDQHARAVHDLAQACREWGFFILVNHGVGEELMSGVFAAVKDFFNMPHSERKKYEPESPVAPVNAGIFNVANASKQASANWRDYIKLHVHPTFNCPPQPPHLSEVLREYSQVTRKIARKLLEAICESLELDENYVDDTLKMDSSFQIFNSNRYPRCPHPDQTIGIPPHTDPGLLTLLIHSGVAGLQIEHDHKWFDADSPQNSILVNVADQLQIMSNGRFKSVKHRAVVNTERERMSIVAGNGPAKDALVGPAPELVERDGGAFYKAMKYVEYMDSLLTKRRVGGKSILEEQMI